MPEVFENDIAAWMEGFHTYLEAYANPLLDQPEDSEAPGPIERVQVSHSSVTTPGSLLCVKIHKGQGEGEKKGQGVTASRQHCR